MYLLFCLTQDTSSIVPHCKTASFMIETIFVSVRLKPEFVRICYVAILEIDKIVGLLRRRWITYAADCDSE